MSNFKRASGDVYNRNWVLEAEKGSGGSLQNTPGGLSAIESSTPSGVSSSGTFVSQQPSTQQSMELKVKKGWELAKSPAKNIFMTGFFLWMIGNGINIFTMPVIIYAVINPVKAILQTNSMFSRFDDCKRDIIQMKITFIAIQLVLLGVTLYKCSSMGLLPITPSDWISSLPIKKNVEFSSGSVVIKKKKKKKKMLRTSSSLINKFNKNIILTPTCGLYSKSLNKTTKLNFSTKTDSSLKNNDINNQNNNNNNSNNQNNNNNNNKKKSNKGLIFLGATAVTILGFYVYFKQNGSEPKIEFVKRIPFRITSNLWGKMAGITIPESLRSPIFKSYSYLFGVNIDEAEKPIEEYPTMGDFFARHLKSNARPIDSKSDMVSPVDGTVIYHGKVEKNTVEQVKGLTYTLEQFLGPEELESIKGKNLYHIGLYLSPGDYHGIHSPVDWKIKNRYHFPGYLFPVAKVAVDNIPGLFAMNERVVLTGAWKHGFYSLTPVGASNVGTIVLDFDKDLHSNNQKDNALDFEKNTYYKKNYQSIIPSGKGDEVAFFRMGSTVILIFEVPEGKKFDFNINPGQHVKFGESMGKLN
ncbi:hypothetical protein DICPUDRAFT_55778 [Dictyostelium purpureum]|uniref:ER membrane protein complex subunit 4 n=1 Tax=Dictyostelium purpureum TaxID=5786 RepID=F0ZNH9_DICPU|nr:uncharacterized protein DICPUDRAFT_55778 [Dictyostelium purpureum]EGC34501.1 hypothetical protein DICPUDRAFT_55778 [Dictyostelium purpureum]|eukprot:XP_003288990.1 hypothetical protein DICPUDRAFT_55778 [Dictyostelium purpureum]